MDTTEYKLPKDKLHAFVTNALVSQVTLFAMFVTSAILFAKVHAGFADLVFFMVAVCLAATELFKAYLTFRIWKATM